MSEKSTCRTGGGPSTETALGRLISLLANGKIDRTDGKILRSWMDGETGGRTISRATGIPVRTITFRANRLRRMFE